MAIDNFCHHLAHPFSANNIQLKSWEKWTAMAGLVLLPFAIVPGLVAFYGLAYYFKSKHVVNIPTDKQNPVDQLAQNIINRASKAQSAPTQPAPSNKPTQFFDTFETALKNNDSAAILEHLARVGRAELEDFLTKRNLTDFELKIGDTVIKTNKAVLAAKSPYFKRTFDSGMQEALTAKMNLEGFSPKIALQAYRCLFGDGLDITADNLMEFLVCGSVHEFAEGTTACEEWVIKNAKSIDRTKLLKLDKRFNLPRLKNLLVKSFLEEICAGKTVDQKKFQRVLRDATTLDLRLFPDLPNNRSIFSHCQKLKTLNVSDCKWFDQSYLQSISHLKELEDLNLSGCDVHDVTPLVTFTNLRHLNLTKHLAAQKRVRDASPLVQLKSLETLILNGNDYIHDLNFLKDLTKLRTLDIKFIFLQDSTFLNCLIELEHLTISGWENPDNNPHPLANCKKLKSLTVTNVNDPAFYIGLPELETLVITNSGIDLNVLNLQPKLQHLTIAQDGFDNILPLGSLKHLKSLKLVQMYGPIDISPLSSLKDLTELDLNIIPISCEPLTHLTQLQNLTLNRGIRQENLNYVFQLSNLKKLTLYSNNSDLDLSFLGSLRNLEYLDIDAPRGSNLTALSNLSCLKSLKIESLKLVDCSPLSKLTQLKELHIPRGKNIKDFSFLEPLRNLRSLYLNDYYVDDFSPFENLKKLKELWINDGEEVSPLLFLTWKNLPKLKRVNDQYLASFS